MMPRTVYAARTRISENCVGWLAWCWPDPTDVAVRDTPKSGRAGPPSDGPSSLLRDMKKSVSET